MYNLNAVSLTVAEIIGCMTMRCPHPFRGLTKNVFLPDVEGKLCSKFGEDKSKTALAVLSVVAGRTPDGHAQVYLLYSVQCYTLHWTDNLYVLKSSKIFFTFVYEIILTVFAA